MVREASSLVGTPRIFAGNLGIIVMQKPRPRGIDRVCFHVLKECCHETVTST